MKSWMRKKSGVSSVHITVQSKKVKEGYAMFVKTSMELYTALFTVKSSRCILTL